KATARRKAPVRKKKATARGKAPVRKKKATARGKAPVRKKKATARRKAPVRKKTATSRRTKPVVPRRLPPIDTRQKIVAAWRMRRQRLENPTLRLPEDLGTTFARTGWLPAPHGSPAPYLALAARFASFSRLDLERALYDEGRLIEMPAVRGENMLLPVADAWIGLQAYRRHTKQKLSVYLTRHRLMTRTALLTLEDVLRAVLAGRDLPVEMLRDKVPPRLVKDFGEVGARLGVPTSVDLALWDLQRTGNVLVRQTDRRDPAAGRRYVLRRDLTGPVMAVDLRSRDEEVWLRALAGRYFAWAGPARIENFAWWADIPAAQARRVVTDLALRRVRIEGARGNSFMLPADAEVLTAFSPPETPGVALVPLDDSLTATLKSLTGLVDPGDGARPLVGWTGKAGAVSRSRFHESRHHFVVVSGLLAGAWEHGLDGVLRYATFRDLSPHVERALSARALAMAEFVRRDLVRPGQAGTEAEAKAGVSTLRQIAQNWSGRSTAVTPKEIF
ncbi:MAG: DNA glycosylase AlkZ-like family protein, partial [Acidobacteriota bacterium]